MSIDDQRRSVRAARRAIGSQRTHLDGRRFERIEALGLLGPAATVAAYLADDGEADPLPWRHVGLGRTVVFPVVRPIEGGDRMTFYPAASTDDLFVGRWGISEPPHEHPIDVSTLTAVLVPLVLFDSRCARAGRGRGYYDRGLAPIDRSLPIGERPALIGIAHDCQRVPFVRQHAADVPLDIVVTPTCTYRTADC